MVEIVSQKPKISIPAWQWPLWVAIALFLLTVAAFAGLNIYLSQIRAEVENISNQIKIEAAKVSPKDAEAIARLNDSLGNFNKLILEHISFAKVLDTIGAVTYQKVVFTDFASDREKNSVQLKGIAQNYTALAKQIVALRKNENIKGLAIKGIGFGDKGLSFDIMAEVDPKLFIK